MVNERKRSRGSQSEPLAFKETVTASGRPTTAEKLRDCREGEFLPPGDMAEGESESLIDQILNGLGEFHFLQPNGPGPGPEKSKSTESNTTAIADPDDERPNASALSPSHFRVGHDSIPPDLRVCYDSFSAGEWESCPLTPETMKLLFEEGDVWADLDLDVLPHLDSSWIDGILSTFGDWTLGPDLEVPQDVSFESTLDSLMCRELFRLPDTLKMPEAVPTTISYPLFPMGDEEIQKELSEGSSDFRASEDRSTSCSTSFAISELGPLDLHQTSKRFGTVIQKKKTLFKKISAELVIVEKDKYGKRRQIFNRRGLMLHKRNGKFLVTRAIGQMH